jgi:hypothetical protein
MPSRGNSRRDTRQISLAMETLSRSGYIRSGSGCVTALPRSRFGSMRTPDQPHTARIRPSRTMVLRPRRLSPNTSNARGLWALAAPISPTESYNKVFEFAGNVFPRLSPSSVRLTWYRRVPMRKFSMSGNATYQELAPGPRVPSRPTSVRVYSVKAEGRVSSAIPRRIESKWAVVRDNGLHPANEYSLKLSSLENKTTRFPGRGSVAEIG